LLLTGLEAGRTKKHSGRGSRLRRRAR